MMLHMARLFSGRATLEKSVARRRSKMPPSGCARFAVALVVVVDVVVVVVVVAVVAVVVAVVVVVAAVFVVAVVVCCVPRTRTFLRYALVARLWTRAVGEPERLP